MSYLSTAKSGSGNAYQEEYTCQAKMSVINGQQQPYEKVYFIIFSFTATIPERKIIVIAKSYVEMRYQTD